MAVKFIDKAGERHDVTLTPELYKAAKSKNLTFRQYINQEFPTTSDASHDTFTQFCASAGLSFRQDRSQGVNSTPLGAILDGNVQMDAAGVVRDAVPDSRILFPAALLEYVEDKLQVDRDSSVMAFEQALAIDTTVANARVEQPVISYAQNDGPEDTRSQIISQLAKPAAMLSITASEVTRKIPTYSLGMEVSDEALRATTLDLVGLALTRQVSIERNLRAGEALMDMLNGDADNGQSALATVTADSLSSADLSAAGAGLDQEAWVKFLYSDITKRRIDWIFTDIDGALAIEDRTGKPVITGDDPNSPRIDTLFNIVHPSLITNVKIFIVDPSVGWTANTIMGIDSRYAIARLTNSEAEYSAIENFVLRRGKGMRFDFGNMYYRLFDEAFKVMTYA